ncbi:MAG: 3TM-type holin [Butyricimonas faecihominis]
MKNVVGAVGEVIDRLTLPAREKRQLEVDLLELLAEHEKEMARSRSAAVVEEARGNWLQRSWRPLVMLVLALIVLVGTFTTLPILSDTSRFWDLLEIGLGGYVVGRSGEKIVQALTPETPLILDPINFLICDFRLSDSFHLNFKL